VNEMNPNPFNALAWDMNVGGHFSLIDMFPDEWCDAWEDVSILPDDPKDMTYE